MDHEFFNPELGRHANELGVHLLGCPDDVTRSLTFVRGRPIGPGAQPGERFLGRRNRARIGNQLPDDAAQAHGGIEPLRFGLGVGADHAKS